MFIKNIIKLFICVAFFNSSLVYCCDFENLERAATLFFVRIGASVDSDVSLIENRLDFLRGVDSGDIAQYRPELFQQLCEDSKHLAASDAFLHNFVESDVVFQDFIKNCYTIYNDNRGDHVKEIAVHLLLQRVLEKTKVNIDETIRVKAQSEQRERALETKRREKISKVAAGLYEDENSNGASHGVTESKDVSVLMKAPSRRGSFVDSRFSPYILYVDNSSLNAENYRYYQTVLQSPSCNRVKITANLRKIGRDSYDAFGDMLVDIDRRKELVEIVLTCGSSMQFNKLLPYLERIYRAHCDSGKQIMIVYSATSASQKAYQKLRELGGGDVNPHLDIREIEGTNPVGIISPSKALKDEPLEGVAFERCSEAALENSLQVDTIISHLKDVQLPVVVQYSPNIGGDQVQNKIHDSGIYKVFAEIAVN